MGRMPKVSDAWDRRSRAITHATRCNMMSRLSLADGLSADDQRILGVVVRTPGRPPAPRVELSCEPPEGKPKVAKGVLPWFALRGRGSSGGGDDDDPPRVSPGGPPGTPTAPSPPGSPPFVPLPGGPPPGGGAPPPTGATPPPGGGAPP